MPPTVRGEPQPAWWVAADAVESPNSAANGLLVPRSARPEPDAVIYCPPTPAALDLPTPHIDDVLELVGELPFEPAMAALGVLAAEVHHHPYDQNRHLMLAAQILPHAILARLRAFMADSPNHLGFDPRHIAAVQRLVIVHARSNDTGGRALTRSELARLGGSLLGVAGALPGGEPAPSDPRSDDDWADWARYTALITAWHHEPPLLEALARAHAMYADVHRDPAWKPPGRHCDLDAWMLDQLGLTFEEQLAGGFACAQHSRAFDSDVGPGERFARVPAGFLRGTALAHKEVQTIAFIAASREELAAAIHAVGDDPARIAWDHTAFERRPFLRTADGSLQLISPRALQSCLTRGIHQRALDAAAAQPHPRRAGQTMASIWLGYAPRLAEEAVRRLVRGSHRHQGRLGIVQLHDEHEYHVGKSRIDSPDLMLDFGEDIVLVEIYAGRISRDARTTLDSKLLRGDLARAAPTKLTQLAERTRELLVGHAAYPDLDIRRVRGVWPVLVLAADPVMQTPALWRELHASAPRAFVDDARVRHPVIVNLDDLEPLLSLVEEDGTTLVKLLGDFLASRHRLLPPRNWISANRGSIARRPAYVREQIDAAMQAIEDTLTPAGSATPRSDRSRARQTSPDGRR